MVSCTWSIKASRAEPFRHVALRAARVASAPPARSEKAAPLSSGGIALFNWNDPNVTKAFHQTTEVRLIRGAPRLSRGIQFDVALLSPGGQISEFCTYLEALLLPYKRQRQHLQP